jgi:hypothetical protein
MAEGIVFATLPFLRNLQNELNKLECSTLTSISSLTEYHFVSYEENEML